MDNILVILITVVTVFIVAKLIIGKKNPLVIFFGAGFILLFYLAITRGYTPMGDDTTGNIFLDIFAFVGKTTKSQLSGVGSNLMVVAGYAALMNYTGASTKLATTAVKPLKLINQPYIILAFLYIIGVILKTMITSHAGLGLLLMATVFPILVELGVSKLSAGCAILMSGALDWGPNDGAVIFAADEVTMMPVAEYVINYQIWPALVSIVTIAIVMAVYFKKLDSKDAATRETLSAKDVSSEEQLREIERAEKLPAIYTILPALPLLLVVLAIFIPVVKMDVFTANVIGIVVTLALEVIFVKEDKFKRVENGIKTVFKQMGTALANIVSLIIAAGVFSNGLIQLGGFNLLGDAIATLEGAQLLTIIMFSILAYLAVVILGSGNAGWFAFGPLVKDLAPNIGLEAYQISVPMQMAASMGRGISPVAAATISIAGLADVEVDDMIKRNFVPSIAGLIANIVASFIIHIVL